MSTTPHSQPGPVPFPETVLLLDPALYQDPRWCADCGGRKTFVEVYEIPGLGREGYCQGCGEWKLVRFSRTMEAGE